MWQSQLCRLPPAFQEMPSQLCKWSVKDASCSSSNISWCCWPRRSMNCQGSLLVMTLGSELQFEWMLSVPCLDLFFGQSPCAQQIQTGPWGSWKRPSKQVYTLSPKRRTMGKTSLLEPGRQKVTKGVTPEQELTLSLLSQKDLTQPRLTSNQILRCNPLPPHPRLSLDEHPL